MEQQTQRRAKSINEFCATYGIARTTFKRMRDRPVEDGGIRTVQISPGRVAILREEEERWLQGRIAAAE
jgi:predicted DNA-binding transcriptional regulator AlpA